MRELLIGHDVGTGGTKTVLADARGNILAKAFEPYCVSYPRPCWAEQDPVDWWRAVASNTRQVLSDSGADAGDVKGVGYSGQMLTFVPVDESGVPLRPAITWLDSRADKQAARLVRKLGGERLFSMFAGAVVSGKDVVAKLQWLRANEPDLYERTFAYLDIAGYLVHRSTGRFSMDQTGAGGTGMLTRDREWSKLLTGVTGVALDKMPPVRRSTEVVGGLTEEASRYTGLREGTPVIAGMSDIPAAATGSGALEHGQGHVYLGTSSWLCTSVRGPVNLPANGIVSVASGDPEMYVMIGESETAGLCLDWFADHLVSPAEKSGAETAGGLYAFLNEEAKLVGPGSDRLLFMPWMFGERAPVTDTAVRGAFLNLSLMHDRGHMLRAIFEGVAYNLRWMIDEVGRKGFDLPELRAIGGGAASDLWMRIVADVTGRKVEAVGDPQEAGALGCALAVAVGLGMIEGYKDIRSVVKVRRTFEPDTANREEYDLLYREYRKIYPALSRAGRRLNC